MRIEAARGFARLWRREPQPQGADDSQPSSTVSARQVRKACTLPRLRHRKKPPAEDQQRRATNCATTMPV